MDLLCARLAVSVLPERINLLDDDILRNLDEKSVLSLNGAWLTLCVCVFCVSVSVSLGYVSRGVCKRWKSEVFLAESGGEKQKKNKVEAARGGPPDKSQVYINPAWLARHPPPSLLSVCLLCVWCVCAFVCLCITFAFSYTCTLTRITCRDTYIPYTRFYDALTHTHIHSHAHTHTQPSRLSFSFRSPQAAAWRTTYSRWCPIGRPSASLCAA